MTTSDADAVANLERVVLEALEIMDEKISKTLAGIERKIDDAVARSLEGRGAAATKRFPKKRNANANAAETSVGAKRAASTARTTMTSSSESSSESKPNEDETKDDSAKTRRANGGRANANGTTTSAKTVKTVKTMKPAVGAKRKRQKTGRTPRGATQDDLTEDEKLLIATGRGRRGEVVSTPLGYAYFTKDDDETILSVGRKIGAEPLTLYSMNRWQLELKKFKIDDVLHPGTRLWIVPNEDWEEEYIREDRAKVLSNLHARIKEVFPDFIKNTRPFVEMRPEDFSLARSSKTFYDDMKATVDAAETNARRVRDDEKLEDITTIRERFDEKWASIGFLKPDDVVSR